MRVYKHIRTDELLSGEKYDELEDYYQEDYILIKSNESNSNGDFISSMAIGALTGSALLGGLLGGDLLGGIVGECLDGDLMD